MPLKKLCSYSGCNKVLDYGVIYCDYHQIMYDNREKERYKEYSNRRREDEQERKLQDFYNSKEWKIVHNTVTKSYLCMDILEYYRTSKIIQGDRLHHIICLRDDWNYRLDYNNLIYLTSQNHERVHLEYNKGKLEKKKMQLILFSLIEQWNKEFGGLV